MSTKPTPPEITPLDYFAWFIQGFTITGRRTKRNSAHDYHVTCPHPDHQGERTPSLHVTLKDDRVLLKCFGGDGTCTRDDTEKARLLAAVYMTMGDLFVHDLDLDDAFRPTVGKPELRVVKATDPVVEPQPWPALQPLPDAMPAAPALTRDMLPRDLSGWVFDIAHRMQCAVDYPAVAAMVALATVVGRKVTIRPKEHDNWYVVPNLWAQIIGPPGVLKSPAVHAAFAPLYKMAADAREAAKQAVPAYEAAIAEYTLQQESLKRQMKSAVDKGEPTAGIKEQLAALRKPEEPSERRFLTNDSTIEKLGLLLVKNTNGLLIERDELSGLFAQMDMKGHEQDRSFYLEAWDGRQSKSIDRVGSGSIWVEHCLLSMIGTGPLAAYLDRFYGEGQTDGFIERFQLSVFPEVPAWSPVDAAPDRKAAARAQTLFTRMEAISEEHQLQFDPPAQALFWAWLGHLEAMVRDERFHPILRSHVSKYRSLMPSLALLFQLALSPVLTTVGVEPTEMAVRWCAYLMEHARRTLWSVIQSDEVSTLQRLVRRLPEFVGEDFTARDVAKKEWSRLKESSVIEEALRGLEALGRVRGARVTHGRSGGRPTTRWTVNPAVATVGRVKGGFAGFGCVGSPVASVEVSSQQQIPTSSSSREQNSSGTDTTKTVETSSRRPTRLRFDPHVQEARRQVARAGSGAGGRAS